MKKIKDTLCLLLILIISNIGFSQNAPLIHIRLKNGNTFIGKQISESGTIIIMQSEGIGEITIQKSNLKSYKKIDPAEIKFGDYWFENPNASRYLFAPSGYSLKAGEGYYQNFMLFYNSIGYGFTDQFTMGFGVIPFTFGDELFATVQAKYSFPIIENKLNAGAGFLYSSGFGDKLGIGYGVLTYGSKDNNITVGAGYGWTDGNVANRPIITINGMTRLGKKFGLVTENWLIPRENYSCNYDAATQRCTSNKRSYKYDLVYGLSLRYIGENITLDFGVVPIDGYAIPLLGVNLPFGKR